MKNHIKVNGRTLQTNKRFSQLKQKQKEWIATVFREKYHSKMGELGVDTKLPREQRDRVIAEVYAEIEARDIWIPYRELEKYCFSKTTKVIKGFKTTSVSNGNAIDEPIN